MTDEYLRRRLASKMHIIIRRINKQMTITVSTVFGNVSTTISDICVLVTNVVVACAVYKQKWHEILMMPPHMSRKKH